MSKPVRIVEDRWTSYIHKWELTHWFPCMAWNTWTKWNTSDGNPFAGKAVAQAHPPLTHRMSMSIIPMSKALNQLHQCGAVCFFVCLCARTCNSEFVNLYWSDPIFHQ